MPVESAADRAVFLNPDEFGLFITWPGSPFPIAVMLQSGTLLIPTQDGPDVQTREATLVVREADLPPGHDQDDVVTLGGETYQVVSILPDGTGMAVIRLEIDHG